VNAELVRDGAAWVYPKYCHDPELYGLEQDAMEAQRGLWVLRALTLKTGQPSSKVLIKVS
jgi:endonuclease YncB( thermonuclease family)